MSRFCAAIRGLWSMVGEGIVFFVLWQSQIVSDTEVYHLEPMRERERGKKDIGENKCLLTSEDCACRTQVRMENPRMKWSRRYSVRIYCRYMISYINSQNEK